LGNFSGTIPQSALTGTTLPVIYSNDSQVSVAAPVTTAATLQLYFSWQGLTLIHPVTIRSLTATPGLFNAYTQPDPQHLTLYATGLGALDGNPALGDFLPTNILYRTTNPVTATIDGIDAEVEFVGGAPGQIGGLYQINLKLPEAVRPGQHNVVISVAGQRSSPLAVTLR
jgi:uncharacterized protein (TIGR03437 family)